MNSPELANVRNCVAHGNRAAALSLLRAAIEREQILPRDGVELMLAVRQGRLESVAKAIETVESAPPGSYRYLPCADYAAA